MMSVNVEFFVVICFFIRPSPANYHSLLLWLWLYILYWICNFQFGWISETWTQWLDLQNIWRACTTITGQHDNDNGDAVFFQHDTFVFYECDCSVWILLCIKPFSFKRIKLLNFCEVPSIRSNLSIAICCDCLLISCKYDSFTDMVNQCSRIYWEVFPMTVKSWITSEQTSKTFRWFAGTTHGKKLFYLS